MTVPYLMTNLYFICMDHRSLLVPKPKSTANPALFRIGTSSLWKNRRPLNRVPFRQLVAEMYWRRLVSIVLVVRQVVSDLPFSKVWDSSNSRVLSSAAAGLINHLINCQHTSSELKALATEKKAMKRQNIGDSPQTIRSPSQYPSEPSIPMPNFLGAVSGSGSITTNNSPGPFRVPDLVVNSDVGSSMQSYRYHPYLTPTRPPFSSDHLPSYPPSSFNSPSLVAADNVSVISRSSSISSLAPSDSLSAMGSHTRQRGRKGKVSAIGAAQIVPWTQDRRRRWERLLVELTASAGFSLRWVENPVWQTMCEEFLPEAPRTSRKVLTNRLLRQVTAELKEQAKALVRGRDVTLQADGWTGLNNNHLIAFMMTCEKLVTACSVYYIHYHTI